VFFFEKKNQKTFVFLVRLQRAKVFWFFFSKKNTSFLAFCSLEGAASSPNVCNSGKAGRRLSPKEHL
jgi:hypothetical protein